MWNILPPLHICQVFNSHIQRILYMYKISHMDLIIGIFSLPIIGISISPKNPILVRPSLRYSTNKFTLFLLSNTLRRITWQSLMVHRISLYLQSMKLISCHVAAWYHQSSQWFSQWWFLVCFLLWPLILTALSQSILVHLAPLPEW